MVCDSPAVSWSTRARHAAPLVVLVGFTLLDFTAGRGQVVYGLLVIVPLVAGFVLDRRATAGYAVTAFAAAALLGVYNDQYTAQAIDTHLIRMLGIALGGGIAVAGCTVRLRTEAALATASDHAATTREALRMTEVLQRSLLTDPPPIPGLQIAARYLPASRHAQIGGDWYDAFTLPTGGTMLVIGDVAGHDAPAAATMAQARGMLRGIATTAAATPAGVLTALDHALTTLGVTGLMTAVVAVLDTTGSAETPGVLRWANAGHPAPVLVGADGTTTVLEPRPELLLGVHPATPRTDHQVTVRPGQTLLLYTDGLIERRRVPLEEGTAWLVGRLQATHARRLDELCDRLLDGMAGRVDDDVALLAVRLDPALQPREEPTGPPVGRPAEVERHGSRGSSTATADAPRRALQDG